MLVMIKAVLWDFGGVILTSPFEAFRRYETEHDLPLDFIRSVNATDPHSNAWALMERNEITPQQFDDLFATESAALGTRSAGADVLTLLARRRSAGDGRDARSSQGRRTSSWPASPTTSSVRTANTTGADRSTQIADIMARFDVIVESSKVGVRKPEPRFYEIACELLGVTTGRVRLPRRPRHQL